MDLETALKAHLKNGLSPPANHLLYGMYFGQPSDGATTESFRKIAGLLSEAGLNDFTVLSSGIESVALAAGEYCLKISPGMVCHPGMRNVTDAVLPCNEGRVAGYGVNISELLDTKDVDLADVFVLGIKLRDQGFVFTDLKTENIGRAKDGLVYVIDYGAVYKSQNPEADFKERFEFLLKGFSPEGRWQLSEQIQTRLRTLSPEDRGFLEGARRPAGSIPASP